MNKKFRPNPRPERRRHHDRKGRDQIQLLESIDRGVWRIFHMLHAHFDIKAQSLVLTITNKEGIPLGNPAQIGSAGGSSSVAEYTGPNGSGAQEQPIGPVQYASDNPAAATVDANTGAITAVAPGSANITATDTGNGLADSVAVTVVLVAQSLVLTVTPNAAPAGAKKTK